MDEDMDEMPSGALNGFTPNEAKKLKVKQKGYQYQTVLKTNSNQRSFPLNQNSFFALTHRYQVETS